MKTKRINRKTADPNSTQPASKAAFRRQYILTIEGEPRCQPVGCSDASHECTYLNGLRELGFIADGVERYYQTDLENRNVTIEPVQRKHVP